MTLANDHLLRVAALLLHYTSLVCGALKSTTYLIKLLQITWLVDNHRKFVHSDYYLLSLLSFLSPFLRFLYQFELFEKNKAKIAAKEGTGGGKCTSTADRGNKTPGHSTVEERIHPQTPAHSGAKGTRSSGDSSGRVNGMERGKRGHPTSSVDTPVPSKRGKSSTRPRKVREGIGKRLAAASETSAASKASGKVKEMETKMEMDEEEDDKNCSSDTKSEVSDSDPPSVDNVSVGLRCVCVCVRG